MKKLNVVTDSQLDQLEAEEQEEFVFIQDFTGKRALITAANIDHATIKLEEQFDNIESWYWSV